MSRRKEAMRRESNRIRLGLQQAAGQPGTAASLDRGPGEGHGLMGWMWERWRSAVAAPRRLALLERVALGPRQSLALVEAEGRRLLVATSSEGTPAFYPLEDGAVAMPSLQAVRGALPLGVRTRPQAVRLGRVSW